MTAIVNISAIMVIIAFSLAFFRLLRGPTLTDRVLAIDLMASMAVSWICLYAIAMDNFVFMDAAIVLALILFLSTIAFAYYLEKKGDLM